MQMLHLHCVKSGKSSVKCVSCSSTDWKCVLILHCWILNETKWHFQICKHSQWLMKIDDPIMLQTLQLNHKWYIKMTVMTWKIQFLWFICRWYNTHWCRKPLAITYNPATLNSICEKELVLCARKLWNVKFHYNYVD